MTNWWKKWLFLGVRLQYILNNLQKVLGSEKCPTGHVTNSKYAFPRQNAICGRLHWFGHCFDHIWTHWVRSRQIFQAYCEGRREYVTLLHRPGKATGSLEVAKNEKSPNLGFWRKTRFFRNPCKIFAPPLPVWAQKVLFWKLWAANFFFKKNQVMKRR